MTTLGFTLMTAVTILLMAAIVAGRLDIRWPVLHQTGDSSLGAHSVNWLAAIALTGAVLICLI